MKRNKLIKLFKRIMNKYFKKQEFWMINLIFKNKYKNKKNL